MRVLENSNANKPEVERRKDASFEDVPHRLQKEGKLINLQDADDLTSLNLLNEDTGLNPSLPSYVETSCHIITSGG